MAGFLFDPSKISELVVALLARSLVLPATVNRVPAADYKGSGGSMRIRIPQPRTAKEQETPGAPISLTTIDEAEASVVVRHLYDGCLLDDESATLELVDFGRQVLQPLAASVGVGAEDLLCEVMNDVPSSFDWQDLSDQAKLKADILHARQVLVENDTPPGSRFLGVSPSVAAAMLAVQGFVAVSEAGSDTALRAATIGTIYGLQVVESAGLTDGTALAYHASGFAFASLSPALPQGAAFAEASQYQGVALRTVADYNAGIMSDQIVIDTFAGATIVDEARIVRIGPEESPESP